MVSGCGEAAGEGQASLACHSPRGRRESDTTEQLNNKRSKADTGVPGKLLSQQMTGGNAREAPCNGPAPLSSLPTIPAQNLPLHLIGQTWSHGHTSPVGNLC